jgi:xylulokinase
MLLGLDVGTTATKALLFDLEGNVRASASASYGLITSQPGWVEQDPEALWHAVVTVLRSIVDQLQSGQQVLAVAQSSQGGTTVPVDAAGQPTYNAISWMDGRAQAEYEELRRQYGGEVFTHKTGWPLMAGLPLQHIRWLRAQQPDIFARSRHFLFVNDFIGRRLTGELCVNPSDASITQLLDIETGDWDDWLLMLAGIQRNQLSPLHRSGVTFGKLTAEASAVTGLPTGLPVVNGGHDQYCAALGMQVTKPGSVLLSCGTAWVLLAVPEDLEVGRRSGMALSCHAVPGRWGAIRSLGAVGTSLDWLIDNIWAEQEGSPTVPRSVLYQAINVAAAHSGPGAHGLIFCPLAGGHAGSFGAARGGFLGLTLTHRRGDLSRAVMEGVACELRWALDEIRAAGVTAEALTMVGGAARSPLWPQIVADVTGVSVSVPAITEAASWGAAVLAGIGVGAFVDVESAGSVVDARSQRLEAGNREMYGPLYERYRLLWPHLSGQSEKVTS